MHTLYVKGKKVLHLCNPKRRFDLKPRLQLREKWKGRSKPINRRARKECDSLQLQAAEGQLTIIV